MEGKERGHPWTIAADALLQSVLDDPECPPLLAQTLTGALSWQMRNETLVGQALASARIAPQWVGALLALGATATVAGDDDAKVPLTDADPTRIEALHVRTTGMRWGEAHVVRTPADEPIVAAIAAVERAGSTVRSARLALTGVWPEPVRLAAAAEKLVGETLDPAHIQAVADAVTEEVAPTGDSRGSEVYRRTMAGVLARRAFEACLSQEGSCE